MKKILFVGSRISSFINNDYEGLKEYFEVRTNKIPPTINPKSRHFYASVYEIWNDVLWCDIVYSWFASWRAIIPMIFAKMLGKKVVVVAGGYDCVNNPEINYGAFTKKRDSQVSKFLFKNADIILPVSDSLQEEMFTNLAKYDIYPKNVKRIYNGIDTDKWYPQGRKSPFVLTVCELNKSNVKRKGLDYFLDAAAHSPEIEFVVVGEFKDEETAKIVKSMATKNVFFTGFVTNEQLLSWYQRAKVYLQLSYHEGFGVSVVEAILCGCIPIVSDKGALPEVVGSKNIIVPYGSTGLTTTAIREAIYKMHGARDRCRAYNKFSLKNRIKLIKEAIE